MKIHRVKGFLRRFRSLSFSFFGFGGGATFAPAVNEREVLLRLVAQVTDRRILFHHSCRVVHEEMIASLEKIRGSITSAIEQIPESAAVSSLISVREACHDLQSIVEAYYRSDPDEPL